MNRASASLAAFRLLVGLGTLTLLAYSDTTALPGHASTVVAAAKSRLDGLVPGMDFVAWYRRHTSFAPDAAHFGVYAITPMTDAGFGRAILVLGGRLQSQIASR